MFVAKTPPGDIVAAALERTRGRVMRLIVLAAAVGLSVSNPGVCQSADSNDFRLSVAYCLGTRQRMIEQFVGAQRRDCVAGALPGACDSERRTAAALQSEAERLRLYLFSKFEEGAGGLADIMATKRGEADASMISDGLATCGGNSNLDGCMASVRKTNPTLAAAIDRLRRCAQIIQMLPF
jgi:hypothetical protein